MRFIRYLSNRKILEKKWRYFEFMVVFFVSFLMVNNIYSQENQTRLNQYQIGPGEKLMIRVHVWGEVARPGQYLVPDGTNVLELISQAGGPTPFSNLKNIYLTRNIVHTSQDAKNRFKQTSVHYGKQIIKINLKSYLNSKNSNSLPLLKPGDVVMVKQNTWYKWQAIIKVISQVAIIIQVWYWYSRING